MAHNPENITDSATTLPYLETAEGLEPLGLHLTETDYGPAVSLGALSRLVQDCRQWGLPDATLVHFLPANRASQRFSFCGGNVVIDPSEALLYYQGNPIEGLTTRSYKLAAYLGSMPGVVRTRRQIREGAWGKTDTHTAEHSVDVAVSQLRREVFGGIVETRKGIGYFAPA